MANEREIKEKQEDRLFENEFSQGMLRANKISEYKRYLQVTNAKTKSGMTAEEIDAVRKRAEEAVNAYK